MGSCATDMCSGGDDEAALANKEIKDAMKAEQLREKRKLRILLLGPGDSGKTTVLKQMRKINHGAISEEELEGFISPIREAVINYIVVLCQQSVLLSRQGYKTDVDRALYEMRDDILLLSWPCEISEELIHKIELLYASPGIQITLKLRSLYQLPDNVAYFVERIRVIAADSYRPSFEDYVRIRMRTTGYSSEEFEVSLENRKFTFEFTDVGGQRSERRKWMVLVQEQIHAVLYILAIAEYDMRCFEDESTGRVQEALDLFKTVMKAGFFDKKSVILFFNKYDLFLEKIRHVPITKGFDDYPTDWDPNDADQVVEFLYLKFQEVFQEGVEETQRSAALHVHCTTALDTDHIEKLLKDIQLDLVRQKLESVGYL